MKKTFLLLFMVASLIATAQPDYRPMLCEGRVWNEHAGAGLYWTKTLYLNGDTVIEGETYKKLYEHATFIINGDTVITDKLQVPVMEKDRRVYAYIHRKVTVYDFTLQPGDSLVLGAQEWVRINKIDTISVKGERYRRFHVTHVLKDFLGVEWPEYESGDADEDAFWVEGIGCDKGLTALFGWVGTAAPYARLSIFDNCMENGETLFTLDDFKMLPANMIACDVNADGVVDVADIATVIKAMAAPSNLPTLGEANADVNGDGIVDVADIATVISAMAGQPSE